MKRFIVFCVTLMLSITIFAAEPANNRPEVQAFITEMVTKHNFDHDALENLFSRVSFNEEVIERMKAPHEAKPWHFYRDFFVTPERISKGIDYWNTHADSLAQAEQKYGVPASIIVAIIGVETKYGENKGKFTVFESLTTLAFNHRPRSTYFRDELKNFLLLTRENNLNPLEVKGSYAGAIGLPQFMPSSYRRYAVDYSSKGYADLINNDEDAIASVANYLKKHGWKEGEEVVIPAQVKDDSYRNYNRKNLRPKLTIKDLADFGIYPAQKFNDDQKAVYIRLENGDEDESWLGLQNCYVISTYNNSTLYVMAVNLLANKINEKKLSEEKMSCRCDQPVIKTRHVILSDRVIPSEARDLYPIPQRCRSLASLGMTN